jgi:hypothetical protein
LGRFVRLWKTEETESSTTYLYGPDPGHVGRLTINKADGVVSSEPVGQMSASASWFFYGSLATEAARRLWHRKSYPSESSLNV